MVTFFQADASPKSKKFFSNYTAIGSDLASKNRLNSVWVQVFRWLIDRITARPYSRWRSRLVDRLLVAIEGGGSDV